MSTCYAGMNHLTNSFSMIPVSRLPRLLGELVPPSRFEFATASEPWWTAAGVLAGSSPKVELALNVPMWKWPIGVDPTGDVEDSWLLFIENCELDVFRGWKNVPLPEFDRLLVNAGKLSTPLTAAVPPDDSRLPLGLYPNPSKDEDEGDLGYREEFHCGFVDIFPVAIATP